MSEQQGGQSRGIGFLGMLAILFIGLKLGGIIAWPWWWVLAPLWIPLLIALMLFTAVGVLMLIALARKQQILRKINR